MHDAPLGAPLGAALAAAIALFAPSTHAGPLTPPPGPPAPTLRTLAQVEPRTDVNSLPSTPSAQHAIGTPGSYYLTGNITNASTTAISVQTSGVVIDLNGFTIDGAFFGGSLVRIDAPTGIVTIRNGTIRRAQGLTIDVLNTTTTRVVLEDITFDTCVGGVELGTGGSVDRCQFLGLIGGSPVIVGLSNAQVTDTLVENSAGVTLGDNAIVERVRMRSIAGTAITAGDHAHISTTVVNNTTGDGIATGASSRIVDSTVSDAGARGISTGGNSRVAGCIATGCGGSGIEAGIGSVITGCAATSNLGSGIEAQSRAVVVDSVATLNTVYGISVGTQSVVTHCSAAQNGANGMLAGPTSLVSRSAAAINVARGIEVGDGSAVHEVVSNSNGDAGIIAFSGSHVESSTARLNGTHGIIATTAATVRNCTATDNGQNSGTGAGIRATGINSLIEANIITGNDRGIELVSTSSVAIRNRARDNGTNYLNVSQPIVSPFALTTASPWANLSQ